MKRTRFAAKLFGAAAIGLAGLGCQSAPQTASVIPTVTPPTPTPTPANMLGVSPLGAPPGPVTYWQKMGLGKQQLEFCRRALCDSPAGALMGRAIAPMSKLTGGLIPPLCSAIPTAGELLDPGAIGANSKVKMDKANAEKRKKAVEELAGVDCHYWPEAEDALIGALRADRNECVRHTAALALQRGCCCTKKTIEALTICVSGSEADGHPCEKSARVRAAAAIALEMCLERACCPVCPIPPDAVPVEEKPKEEKPKGEEPKKNGESKTSAIAWTKPGPDSEEMDAETAARKAAKKYYDKAKQQSMEQLLAKAKRALETMPPLPLDLSIPQGHPDYEAAGVRTYANADGSPRPANVYDMIVGKAPSRVDAAPVMPKSAMTKVIVESPVAAVPMVKPTIEPMIAKPVIAAKVEDTPWPAPTAKAKAPAAMAAPARIPTNVDAAPVTPMPPAKPADVVPIALPAAKPLEVKAPAAPAAKPVEVKTPAMPISKPVESAMPKPMPATISKGVRVMKMLDEASDLGQLRAAIDGLTTAEFREQPKLAPALIKAAEYPSDTGLRVACLKAVGRGKTGTPEVAAGLERIRQDRDAVVAAEAGRILLELKAGK